MLTSESRRKLTAGAMFGLPVGIVLIAANVMGPTPPASEAAPLAPMPAILPGGTHGPGAAMSPRATAALAHIESLSTAEFGRSPLYHPTAADQQTIETDPRVESDPEFTIQLIMASSGGNVVLIEDRKYRVGDELAETGWIVIDIDAVSRSVSIEDPRSGRVRRHTVDGRGNRAGKANVIVRSRSDDADADEAPEESPDETTEPSPDATSEETSEE